MARITFEVSVRLLGGLMALGYTIATILKRVSKVYSDDVLSVKVDKLELLQQKFIQLCSILAEGCEFYRPAPVLYVSGEEELVVDHPPIRAEETIGYQRGLVPLLEKLEGRHTPIAWDRLP